MVQTESKKRDRNHYALIQMRQELNNYKRQITTLGDNLKVLHKGYESIVSRLSVLKEKINVFGSDEAQTDPTDTGYHSTGTGQQIVALLLASGCPLSVPEIITNAKQEGFDIIPLHIIDERAFMKRWLKKSCDKGMIVIIEKFVGMDNYYALPEWIDNEGMLLPMYEQ